MKVAPIEKCPHCGSSFGFYLKGQIVGKYHDRYRWSGIRVDEDNQDMHDHLLYTESKYAYCVDCNKRLFKVEEANE